MASDNEFEDLDSESGGKGSYLGSHKPYYPYPYYYGHQDYSAGRPFLPPPHFSSHPLCESAQVLYPPARFGARSQGDPASYDIEVSFK